MNGAYPGMWDDNAVYGLKLSGNYYLPGLNKAYMATGHNSAFVDEDGKKYLYDLLAIKKETSSPLES